MIDNLPARKSYQQKLLFSVGLVLLAILGCQPAPIATRPTARAAPPESSVKVQTRFTKAEFGERWPFSVDAVEVDCIPLTNDVSQGAIVLHTNKGTYGINGKIRKENLQAAGSKVPLPQVIVESGSNVCKQRANS
jgi:hypothetical protein